MSERSAESRETARKQRDGETREEGGIHPSMIMPCAMHSMRCYVSIRMFTIWSARTSQAGTNKADARREEGGHLRSKIRS
jgi:hypothetical protein